MESKPSPIVAASFMGVYADAGVVYPKRIRDFEPTDSSVVSYDCVADWNLVCPDSQESGIPFQPGEREQCVRQPKQEDEGSKQLVHKGAPRVEKAQCQLGL